MTFNSVTFFTFLVLVLTLYWGARPKYRNLVLLASSYVFYGWWDWRFLGLLATTTIVGFVGGHLVHRSHNDRHRLVLLWTGVVINLGILATFKYAGFFADSFRSLARSIGFEADGFTLNVVLPVGISFYTFQAMSYLFDIYRRRIDPTRNLVIFGTYVAYFPQLVAGPIERAQDLLPEITQTNRTFPRGAELNEAFRLILWGLFKKVVIADGVAVIVNDAFASPEEWSWIALTAAVVGFSIQIYGDFSGYTDIARGVSKLLGISLLLNFAEPYLSRNITEFWRRWHISLSTWLRDYLYIPLGGNRGSTVATFRNLMLTMLLGGLWHGAAWTFVVWGGLHGVYLIAHRMARGGSVDTGPLRLRHLPSILATNLAVMIAWTFFRADSVHDAWSVLHRIVTLSEGSVSFADVALIAFFAVVVVFLDVIQRRILDDSQLEPKTLGPAQSGALAGAMIVGIIVFSGGAPVPFIYFQF
jgi:alginate O-acetyltransferase complex protein AlgI